MYRRTAFLKIWEDDPGKAKKMFMEAMEKYGGSVPRVARALEMSRVTVYRYLRAEPDLQRHQRAVKRALARAAAQRLELR